MELLAFIIYICTRELFHTYYYYMVFRDQLAVSHKVVYAGLAILTLVEILVMYCFDPHKYIFLQFLTTFLYLPFGFYCVKAPSLKKLLVILLIAQQTFLLQTLALVVKEQVHLPISNTVSLSMVLLLLNVVFFPFFMKVIDEYRSIFVDSQEDRDILVLANIILLLNFFAAVSQYDFTSPRDWFLFWGRLFITVPGMLFIHIIYYLVNERDKHRSLTRTQNYLATLRENEKLYFEYIFETWQNARRIRHDLRHMSLLLKEYLAAGEYAKIKEVLKQIQQQTSTFNTEENNDANTKNNSL